MEKRVCHSRTESQGIQVSGSASDSVLTQPPVYSQVHPYFSLPTQASAQSVRYTYPVTYDQHPSVVHQQQQQPAMLHQPPLASIQQVPTASTDQQHLVHSQAQKHQWMMGQTSLGIPPSAIEGQFVHHYPAGLQHMAAQAMKNYGQQIALSQHTVRHKQPTALETHGHNIAIPPNRAVHNQSLTVETYDHHKHVARHTAACNQPLTWQTYRHHTAIPQHRAAVNEPPTVEAYGHHMASPQHTASRNQPLTYRHHTAIPQYRAACNEPPLVDIYGHHMASAQHRPAHNQPLTMETYAHHTAIPQYRAACNEPPLVDVYGHHMASAQHRQAHNQPLTMETYAHHTAIPQYRAACNEPPLVDVYGHHMASAQHRQAHNQPLTMETYRHHTAIPQHRASCNEPPTLEAYGHHMASAQHSATLNQPLKGETYGHHIESHPHTATRNWLLTMETCRYHTAIPQHRAACNDSPLVETYGHHMANLQHKATLNQPLTRKTYGHHIENPQQTATHNKSLKVETHGHHKGGTQHTATGNQPPTNPVNHIPLYIPTTPVTQPLQHGHIPTTLIPQFYQQGYISTTRESQKSQQLPMGYSAATHLTQNAPTSYLEPTTLSESIQSECAQGYKKVCEADQTRILVYNNSLVSQLKDIAPSDYLGPTPVSQSISSEVKYCGFEVDETDSEADQTDIPVYYYSGDEADQTDIPVQYYSDGDEANQTDIPVYYYSPSVSPTNFFNQQPMMPERQGAYATYPHQVSARQTSNPSRRTMIPIDRTAEIAVAAGKGDMGSVQRCLDRGDDVDTRGGPDKGTVLMTAVKNNQIDIAQLLLIYKADVNALERNHHTPLIIAATYRHHDMITLLLHNGANVNATDDVGGTALHRCAQNGDVVGAQTLLQAGAKVNVTEREQHQTPLILAVNGTHHDMIDLLLDNGADVNVEDGQRLTALHRCSADPDVYIALALIEAGAAVNVMDIEQRTPLMLAAKRNCAELVNLLLLKYMAQKYLRDKMGKTALDWAKEWGHTKIIQILTGDVNADKSVIFWGDEGLMDKQFKQRIQDIHIGYQCEILLLYRNNLTTCNLDSRQFDKLQTLNLAGNNISEISYFPKLLKKLNMSKNNIVTVRDLPETIVDIDLSYNYITDIPLIPESTESLNIAHNEIQIIANLSSNMKSLDLSYNEIREIKNIPESTESLNIAHNAIKIIANISSNIKSLDLSFNEITEIQNVPPSTKVLNVSNNKVSAICHLPSDISELDISSNCITDLNSLPRKLISLKSSQNRITDIPDLSNSIKYLDVSNNPIVTVTRLPTSLRSCDLGIISFQSECFDDDKMFLILTRALTDDQIDKLTQPPPEIFRKGYRSVKQYFKDSSISKMVETSTSRYILTGDTTAGKTSLMKSLIAQKSVLTDTADRTQVLDIQMWGATKDHSIQMLDTGGHPIYDVTSPFFVTKNTNILMVHDLNAPDRIERTLAIMKRHLQQHPSNSMNFALTHTDQMADENQILEQLGDFMDKVKELLGQEMSSLKLIEKSKSDIPFNLQHLIEAYQIKKENCKYFLVSSLNMTGIPELTNFMTSTIAAIKVNVPELWVKCFQKLHANGKNFYTLGEFENIYDESYTEYVRQKRGLYNWEGKDEKETMSEVESNSSTFYQYLVDASLILVFPDHTRLKDYIFHDMTFLSNLFKSLLDHELENKLCYDIDDSLKASFMEDEFKDALKDYMGNGILVHKLLAHLWEKYNLNPQDEMALVEALKSFDILYDVHATDEKSEPSLSENTYFCPWFVKSKDVPYEINNPKSMDHKTIELRLKHTFHNQIPANVTEHMFVRLQQYAVEHQYQGKRIAWADGLIIDLASFKLTLVREEPNITLSVTGDVCDLDQIWESVEDMYNAQESVVKPWKGVVRSCTMMCLHCRLKDIDEPHLWNVNSVIRQVSKVARKVECPKSNEILPAALTHPMRGAGERKRQQIKEVEEYLKKHYLGQLSTVRLLLHPDPVILQLRAMNQLTPTEIAQLKHLSLDQKVDYLVDKFLLGRQDHFIDVFRQAMRGTGYHSNVILANTLPGYMYDSTRNMELSRILLTDLEKAQILSTYKEFVQYVDPNKLARELFASYTVDDDHLRMIKAIELDQDKCTYLIDNILLRGTYQTLENFREALSQLPENTYLLELLPVRSMPAIEYLRENRNPDTRGTSSLVNHNVLSKDNPSATSNDIPKATSKDTLSDTSKYSNSATSKDTNSATSKDIISAKSKYTPSTSSKDSTSSKYRVTTNNPCGGTSKDTPIVTPKDTFSVTSKDATGVTSKDIPCVRPKDTNRAISKGTLITTSKYMHSASSKYNPCVTSNYTPSVRSKDTPIVRSKDTPSARSKATPSVRSKATHSFKSKATPSVRSKDSHNTSSKYIPRVTSKDTPKVIPPVILKDGQVVYYY